MNGDTQHGGRDGGGVEATCAVAWRGGACVGTGEFLNLVVFVTCVESAVCVRLQRRDPLWLRPGAVKVTFFREIDQHFSFAREQEDASQEHGVSPGAAPNRVQSPRMRVIWRVSKTLTYLTISHSISRKFQAAYNEELKTAVIGLVSHRASPTFSTTIFTEIQ